MFVGFGTGRRAGDLAAGPQVLAPRVPVAHRAATSSRLTSHDPLIPMYRLGAASPPRSPPISVRGQARAACGH